MNPSKKFSLDVNYKKHLHTLNLLENYIFLKISLSGNKITNLAFRGRIMGGKVNVSFYNQYSSKLVLLGDIYLPPPLWGLLGLSEVLGDIYPLTVLRKIIIF